MSKKKNNKKTQRQLQNRAKTKENAAVRKKEANSGEIKLEVPTSLKVLCILSFIGFVFCLVRDSSDYFAYSNYDEIGQGTEAFDKMETRLAEFDKNDIDVSPLGMEKLTLSATYRTIFDVLAMVGTALMYFRIKRGFYIYGMFQLLYVIVPFAMFGIGAMVVYDKLALVPPLIYLILFTTQFKHLNR